MKSIAHTSSLCVAGRFSAPNKPPSIGSGTSGRISKKARELGAHLAFLDERGFLLIPTRRRTWGPEGDTPIVPYSYKHDRISALAVLTISPIRRRIGLYARFRHDNFKAVDVAPFLKEGSLVEVIHGPLQGTTGHPCP